MILLAALLISACKNNSDSSEEQTLVTQTPVTVDTVKLSTMIEYTNLNANASFLQKNIIKANAAGYIQTVNVHLGDYVNVGTGLFSIKTKEAQSIGNTINNLNPSFRFTGVTNIKASKTGYVTQIDHQLGDYVQDGEQLGVVTDKNSFAFLLNVPYELHAYVTINKPVSITLPDNSIITGRIASALPKVDSVSQAQTYVIKTDSSLKIPENLIGIVKVVKSEKANAVSVPKSAILSDDTQTDFWVMKLTDSNTAIKVTIKKGMETSDRVEVISNFIHPSDIVLISGNFGLADTAKVKVTNK